MKRAIPFILMCTILMSGCYEDFDYADSGATAVSQTNTIAESAEETTTGDISDESNMIVEESSDMMSLEEVHSETQDVPEEPEQTEAQETEAVSEYEQPEASDAEEETETTILTTCMTKPAVQTETTVGTEWIPEIAEETEPAETTAETVVTTTVPTESGPSDYEKALTVYEYMRENGSGTCVNYACQTYERCQEIGLPCYIVWTDSGLYGHVANTVCVNGIWFVMDTQAGCFLDCNYGFTEVVDIDENYIADGGMLSECSYQELFG